MVMVRKMKTKKAVCSCEADINTFEIHFIEKINITTFNHHENKIKSNLYGSRFQKSLAKFNW